MIPRSYQEEAINSIYEFFMRRDGNPLVAMPTATGKSLVICEFIRRMFYHWPNSRVLCLVHVKELIEQSARTMRTIWPNAPIGINSASLKQRDTLLPIIFGGIASVHKHAELFGHRDMIFIDEAHLISPDSDTMYQKFIAALRAINPRLKVVGFTATHFRLKQGLLIDPVIEGQHLFTDICFNICDVEGFARLIHEGYLSPPIPKVTRTKLDVSQVGVAQGEFIQRDLQTAVDKHDITYSALQEMCEHGHDRRAWLIFCSGIEHADHCADMLNSFGIPSAAVHSKITDKERDERINAFKRGELRAITNNNVLTTGFDYPPIDLIGMLRPTMSPGLWVQMVGRGTRPSTSTDKANCLVLDFAGNTRRLGPIDDPRIPGAKGPGTGEIPVKICDACGTYNHTRVRFCICCGAEFAFETKIRQTASTQDILSNGMPIVETHDISRVMYTRYVSKKSNKPGIRVAYLCGLNSFNEFVTFEADHPFAVHRAHEWWKARHTSTPPLSTDMALQKLMELRTPRRVRVWMNKLPNPQVLNVEW
jgi:DNA repair protein RadD